MIKYNQGIRENIDNRINTKNDNKYMTYFLSKKTQ